jgi:mono/diheme cytochrome c family protein/glucose/arabinose dehydrogenase
MNRLAILAAAAATCFTTLRGQIPASKWDRVPHRPDDPQVAGTVRDAVTGAAVEAGMEVDIIGTTLARLENSQVEYYLKADGKFIFTLPPGSYDLATTGGTFARERVHLVLHAGDKLQHDFNLRRVPTGVYRVEDVPTPRQMVPEISGIAFTPQGTLFVCTRRGEVWSREPRTLKWRRFAFGLFEPFGIVAESERDVFVSERGQLTHLSDSQGRGEADVYEVLNNATGMTGNYHEFAYGLARDRFGNFYGANGMSSKDGDNFADIVAKGALKLPKNVAGDSSDDHRSLVPYEGWAWEANAAGDFIPLATGFRQALGIGLSPNDELFATDISGSWIPTSQISHVEKGHFYGHPDGLKWDPAFRDRNPTVEELRQMRTPPAVYVPRGPMGSGLGNPVWDTTGGRFGPFAGQMLLPDWTGVIVRADLEKVAGADQGCAFLFLSGQGLNPGSVRAAFGPDGALYVGQTLRGWASTAKEGLQRVVWTGAVPVEILTMHLTGHGFRLRFTQPMRMADLADAAQYRFKRFRYNYSIDDGSLRMDEVDVPVTSARPDPDGAGVQLDLAELKADFVYELSLGAVRSAGGAPVANPLAYYTANRLLAGQPDTGPSRLAPVAAVLRPGNPDAGQAIFRANCVICHQWDGRGSKQVGTPDFTMAGGPLTKPDDQLIHQITFGGKVMPPFGHVLPAQDIADVLSYLHQAFGKAASAR